MRSASAGSGSARASLLRDLAALTMNEMMPWDYWGPVRAWGPGSDVSREWLERFDALAKALATEPADYQDAAAILEEHIYACVKKMSNDSAIPKSR